MVPGFTVNTFTFALATHTHIMQVSRVPASNLNSKTPMQVGKSKFLFMVCICSLSIYNCCCCCSIIQSCPALCNPMDCSIPGSSFRAWITEWIPFPTPGSLPDLGIQPTSLGSPALVGRFFTTNTTWEAQNMIHGKKIVRKTRETKGKYNPAT